MSWRFFLDPSFGVLVAFLVFVVLVFKPALRAAKTAIQNYRREIEKDLKECESLLADAQDAVQEAYLLQTQVEEKVRAIEEAAKHQREHLQQEIEESTMALRIQHEEAFEQRINYLNQAFISEIKEKVMTQALAQVRDTIEQSRPKFNKSILPQVGPVYKEALLQQKKALVAEV